MNAPAFYISPFGESPQSGEGCIVCEMRGCESLKLRFVLVGQKIPQSRIEKTCDHTDRDQNSLKF